MDRLFEPSFAVKLVSEKHEGEMAVRSVLLDSLSSVKTYPTNQRVTYRLKPRLPISRHEIASLWDLPKNSSAEDPHAEDMVKNYSQARLVLLIDQQGSMEPFSPEVEALKKSFSHRSFLDKPNLYYFHDCPEGFLCKQPGLVVTLPLQEVLSEQARGSSVLIVSDAGAARGYYDGRRVANTRIFLKILRTYTILYAWLNPMPTNRWGTTTAEDIERMVPMFPLDRKGLKDAINVLMGHPFPSGVSIDE